MVQRAPPSYQTLDPLAAAEAQRAAAADEHPAAGSSRCTTIVKATIIAVTILGVVAAFASLGALEATIFSAIILVSGYYLFTLASGNPCCTGSITYTATTSVTRHRRGMREDLWGADDQVSSLYGPARRSTLVYGEPAPSAATVVETHFIPGGPPFTPDDRSSSWAFGRGGGGSGGEAVDVHVVPGGDGTTTRAAPLGASAATPPSTRGGRDLFGGTGAGAAALGWRFGRGGGGGGGGGGAPFGCGSLSVTSHVAVGQGGAQVGATPLPPPPGG